MEEKKYICKGCGNYFTSKDLDETNTLRPVKDCLFKGYAVTASPACVLVEYTDEQKELYDKFKSLIAKFE